MNLNQEQQSAVSFKNGPCMVLAGPGSGKTAVITHRILHLIEKENVEPSTILTITFTRAAALEMQSRFFSLSDSKYTETAFGTFHSVFYRILKDSVPEKKFNFMKGYEPYRLMEQVLKELNLNYSSESVKSLLAAVSAVKNGLSDKSLFMISAYEKEFPQIEQSYEKLRKELDYIGFDDIIPDCIRLFMDAPKVLNHWRERFKYIQVDEFQDVNAAQVEILKLLCAPLNNIFAVGDDDQSIYGFRGSEPKAMLEFEKIFPGAVTLLLGTNYRSVPEIIRSSSLVIKENKLRLEKKSSPFRNADEYTDTNPIFGKGVNTINKECAFSLRFREGAVSIISFLDSEKELKAIPKILKALGSARSTAILTRTNDKAALISLLLEKEGLPFVLREKLIPLTDEPVAQDILSYMRVALGPVKRADFLRIMNRPVRYFSRDALDGSLINRARLNAYYSKSPHMLSAVNKLFRDLELLGRLSPSRGIDFIRRAVGYERFLKQQMNPETFLKAQSLMDRLYEKALLFSDTSEFLLSLEDEKNTLAEISKKKLNTRENENAIKLMTMHSSKGLEFKTVIIPFLNEGTLPKAGIGTAARREEERRLLYVAMTRAKDCLIMSCAESKDSPAISSFLKPLLSNKRVMSIH